jgi:hypothetical protein
MKKKLIVLLINIYLILININCKTKAEGADYNTLFLYLITERFYTSDIAKKDFGYSVFKILSSNCTLGGSSNITVTRNFISTGSGIYFDVTYNYNNCKDVIVVKTMSTTLTLDGDVDLIGTISDISDDYTYSSSNLSIVGTQKDTKYILGTPIKYNKSCDLSINKKAETISGTVCSKDFTY